MDAHSYVVALPLEPAWEIPLTASDIIAFAFGGDDAMPFLAFGVDGVLGIADLHRRTTRTVSLADMVHVIRWIGCSGSRCFVSGNPLREYLVREYHVSSEGVRAVTVHGTSGACVHNGAAAFAFPVHDERARSTSPAPAVAIAKYRASGFQVYDLTTDCCEEVRGRWGMRFGGWSGEVTALALRPDGAQIASGYKDGRVRFWGTHVRGWFRSRRIRMAWPTTFPSAIRALAWTSDGSVLSIATADGILRFLDAETGVPVAPPRHVGPTSLLVVAPDRRWIAARVSDANRIAHIACFDFGAPDFGIPPPWDRPFV